MGAVSQQQVVEQGRQVCKRYQDFFATHGKHAAIRSYYPNAEEAIARFERWFTGNQVNLPTYKITVTGARMWWNVDAKIDPVLVVRCNGTEVKGEQFDRDAEGRSGMLKLSADNSFKWAPFDRIEVVVLDKRLIKNSVLKRVQFSGFAAGTGLLDEQPLDQLDKADSALSRVQLLCEFEHDGQAIEARHFPDHLQAAEPRVIPFVRADLKPEVLALEFWLLHHPSGYYRSAAIYEDLYRTDGEADLKLAHLARAMVAYFRAFAFTRCAELARKIPDDAKISVAMRSHLPPWIDVAGLRRLGEVAARARELPGDSEAFRCLSRVNLNRQSLRRLMDVVKDVVQRKEVALSNLEKWHLHLEASLVKDRRAAEALQDAALQSFLLAQIREMESDLRSVKRQLERPVSQE